MGLAFTNPAMLYGASLAAVPLLIHLYHRRRAQPHAFAAIDFVLRSQRRTARRLRVKRLLLFLVRTLLLAALPVAMARPHFSTAAAQVKPSGPAATAIILDTSLSMSYRHNDHSVLDKARQMAREALSGLSPDDSVTFVSCDEAAEPPQIPGFDRGKVREQIDHAPQTFGLQDLTLCTTRAAQALAQSSLQSKRLILATDLTAASFRLDTAAPTITTAAGEVRPEVVLLDAADGAAPLANVAITNLRVQAAPAMAQGAFQFVFTVANHSPKPVSDLTVTIRVEKDVVAKSFVDVPAMGSTVKTLTYRFPGGGVFSGAIQIAHDALEADDVHYFVVRVPKEVKALVVDGAPNTVRFLDGAFFVQAALDAPGSPVRPVLRDVEGAAKENFANYDLIMLLNVRALPAAKVAELDSWTKQGGGLLVSLGDQVDAEAYNELFGGLLPRKLHLVKTAAERKETDPHRKPAQFGQVLFDHPAFSIFTGDAREGLFSARTYRYFLLMPGDASQVTQLAAFDDGAPALLLGQHGNGRVLLYTSTVDRSWTDWPIRTSFLPIVQRLAGWLSGVLDERSLEQVMVGQAKSLAMPAGGAAMQVAGPQKEPMVIRPANDGRLELTTREPGIYAVSAKIAGSLKAVPEQNFAVNVDPRESNLARLDERELKAYFGEKTKTQKADGKDESTPPFSAWSTLLALAVVLLLAEGALLKKAVVKGSPRPSSS